MPELTLYHLNFKGKLHLGRRGIGQEETGSHLPADTLFAALIVTQVEAGLDPKRLPLAFPRRLSDESLVEAPAPFLLTSAFPVAGEIRFYPPPPLSHLNISDEIKERRLKELKRIKYISEKLFERVITGENLDAWLPPEDDTEPATQGLYLQGKSLWLTTEEINGLPAAMQKANKRQRPVEAFRYLKVWHAEKVPRVTVDRLRNASNIFHTGRLGFSSGCGLWFGVTWQDKSWQPEIAQLLDLMADGGMGGERAVGYGHFTWQNKEVRQWPAPKDGDLFITLSRYHPHTPEALNALNDNQVAYELVSVGGWLGSMQTSAQRRRRLWMIAEGSVLRAVGPGPWGNITDVKPIYQKPHFLPPPGSDEFPHEVWRYGLAYPVAFGGAL